MDNVYTIPCLLRATMSQNRPKSAEHDAEIKAERPILDVIEVEGATFVKSDVAATGDLSEAGQPRFHRQE